MYGHASTQHQVLCKYTCSVYAHTDTNMFTSRSTRQQVDQAEGEKNIIDSLMTGSSVDMDRTVPDSKNTGNNSPAS
jgi:hypothetical protein